MNKLVLIFISILIFLVCYYQINKIKENFSSTDINDKDIVPEYTDETVELIKRHQVDYAKKVYDTKFLFDKHGKLMKTKTQISFWEPLIDSAIYSLGTAVSDNLERPTFLYTAIEGAELINPIEFKMIYRFGGLKSNLITKINKLKESLPSYINKIENYQKNNSLGKSGENELDDSNKEIDLIETEIDFLTRELNNGIFSVWRPTPPEGYKTLGDMLAFGHNQPMLSEIKCVPERCTKETRNWDIKKDRKMILEDGNIRISFFRNPFHMTLHTFTEEKIDNRWQYKGEDPEKSKIIRIYPCIPKCDYVDNLVKANSCAKNMCINKKNRIESTPLIYRKSSIEAENIMLDEIKEQDLLLEKLRKTAEELHTKQSKFNIVNQEFNRHEFSKYLKDQKDLHWDTINKLYKTRKGVAVNINSPGGLTTLKSMLKDYLKGHAKQLKNKTISGDRGKNCTDWTEFKQNHRCKYSDPPCFGCVNPT